MYASTHAPSRESRPPFEAGSLLTRIASAFGTATLAALVASVPAAVRVVPSLPGVGPLVPWLVFSAVSLPPLVVAVLVLRGTRRGLAAYGGAAARVRALGLALWLMASASALVALGAMLRATTHHHGLAGATFGVFGLVLLVGLGALVGRVLVVSAAWRPQLRALVFGGGAAVALAPLLVLAAGLARGVPSHGLDLLIDSLAYGVAAALASSPALARRPVDLAGPPMALLVLLVGLARPIPPGMRPPAPVRAPLLAPALRLAVELGR